eukprot:UN02209
MNKGSRKNNTRLDRCIAVKPRVNMSMNTKTTIEHQVGLTRNLLNERVKLATQQRTIPHNTRT